MTERHIPDDPSRGDDESRGYNGWKNYPTWAVYTWLSNEEFSYYRAQAIVNRVDEPARAADDLRDDVRDTSPLAEDSSLYADILGWALQTVDWEAVARGLGPEEWEDDDSASLQHND